jgi:hypothetical protein
MGVVSGGGTPNTKMVRPLCHMDVSGHCVSWVSVEACKVVWGGRMVRPLCQLGVVGRCVSWVLVEACKWCRGAVRQTEAKANNFNIRVIILKSGRHVRTKRESDYR